MIIKRYLERYINGKPTKSRTQFSKLYVYAVIPYSVENLKKLNELTLYFSLIDAYVYRAEFKYQIELRIYKPKSYLLIAFLYNFFKNNGIDNFKIFEANKNKGVYPLIDTATEKADLRRGYIK